MKKPERLKPYKNAQPYDTIVRARGILKECDLFVSENTYYMSKAKTFTSRIWLSDDDIFPLSIGTNGKGMTARYALASAYGELMERIQNMCININNTPECFPEGCFYVPTNSERDFPEYSGFMKSVGADSPFLFTPDEKWKTVDEIVAEAADILRKMRVYKNLSDSELKQMLSEFSCGGRLACVPFYGVSQKKQIYLPYKILKVNTLCNGMCAGNSHKEAIIQGLSEIYERYAQQTVIMGNIEVPSIPEELFAGTPIYEKLMGLKEQGIAVDILDFSCDMGLPVLALKLINETGAISIHPGADPCPITALERCLTETYQGADGLVTQLRYKARPIPMPDENNESQLDGFYANLKECFVYGAGGYPNNIHNSQKHLDFKGFDHPVSVSDDDDLDYMLSVAKQNGYEVYVRDNSFLGFPAFDILIPGMSDIAFFRGPKARNYLEYGKELYTLLSLPKAPLEDVETLYEFLLTDSMKKYASISLKDCFPIGVSEYLPEGILEINTMLEALKEQIRYLRGSGEAVFTRENWPVCYDCSHCAYQKECKQAAFVKAFHPIREKLRENSRPQIEEMFQTKHESYKGEK